MRNLLLLILGFARLVFAFVLPGEIITKTLSNGLEVLILPRKELDFVAIQMWLKVGSIADGEKKGLLHFLEHSLFCGTEKFPPGKVDEAVEDMGGRVEAETGQDFTYISVELPASYLPRGLEILSQLVIHPTFDEEALEKERAVVISEIKSAANPFQRLAWQVAELMFPTHPYRYPIPGDENSVKGISRDDLISAWHNFYVPSNAVLIIVGKVEPQEALKWSEQYFNAWEERDTPLPFFPPDPPLKEVKRKILSNATGETYFAFGFPAPSAEQKEEVAAMDIVHQIMEDGEIFSPLKEKGLITYIEPFFLTQRYPSIFYLYGSASLAKGGQVTGRISSRSGMDVEVVEKEILRAIKNLGENITEKDLEKAKKRLLFSFMKNCETYADQAHMLGFYQSINSYSFACEYPNLVQNITLEKLKEIMKKFFKEDAYCVIFSISEKK